MKYALRIGNQYYTMQVLIDASLEDWKYGRTEGWKVGFPLSHIPSRFMCGAARVLLSLMCGCARMLMCVCTAVAHGQVCDAARVRVCACANVRRFFWLWVGEPKTYPYNLS